MTQLAIKICLLAVLYITTGKIGLLLAAPPGYATVIWPPSGIAIGMLIMHGWRLWPGVLAGSFILNCHIAQIAGPNLFTNWEKAGIALIIAVGSTAQALTAYTLIKRCYGLPLSFKSIRHAFGLLLLSGPLVCVIAATIGVGALFYSGTLSTNKILENWATWWVGDIFGVAIFLPLMLVAPGSPHKIRWQNQPFDALPAYVLLTLLLPLGITFYAWKAANEYIYKKSESEFISLVLESESTLLHRLDSYGLALHSSKGFFDGSVHVSRHEWKAYVDSLNIGKYYPGINGLGYIEYVQPEEIKTFLANLRHEVSDFSVHPEGNHPYSFIIKYIEPLLANRAALGLNIAFEKSRLDAALLSRDTGNIVLTRHITLVQDTQKRAGFLMLLPYYRPGLPVDTVEQRRTALLGWVYTPFIAKKFLDEVTPNYGELFHMEIRDEGDTKPFYTTWENPPPQSSRFVQQKTIQAMQQPWTITWRSTPEFETREISDEPLLIMTGGLTFTALFALFLVMLTHRSQIVKKLVEERTLQLRENENRLNTILDMAPNGILAVDAKGIITSINKAIADIFGYSDDELIGKPLELLLPTEYNDGHMWSAVDGTKHKETSHIAYVRDVFGVRKDGSRVPIEVKLNRTTLRDGSVQVVASVQDVTEIRKTEREREQLVGKLTESNTELERFAYVASHDLREPIRLVCSFTDLLQQEYAPQLDDTARKYIGIISMATRRMNTLVKDLLDYARVGHESEKYEQFESQDCLNYVLETMGESIRAKNAQIIAEPMPTLFLNQTRFTMLLQNLIGNGLKYQREGVSPIIRINAENKGTEWLFSVRDNGIGIKPEYRLQVFEPFKRLHSQSEYEGTGMGLAICRKIIDRMNGRIWMEDAQGGGSCFYFTVPITQQIVSDQI